MPVQRVRERGALFYGRAIVPKVAYFRLMGAFLLPMHRAEGLTYDSQSLFQRSQTHISAPRSPRTFPKPPVAVQRRKRTFPKALVTGLDTEGNVLKGPVALRLA